MSNRARVGPDVEALHAGRRRVGVRPNCGDGKAKNDTGKESQPGDHDLAGSICNQQLALAAPNPDRGASRSGGVDFSPESRHGGKSTGKQGGRGSSIGYAVARRGDPIGRDADTINFESTPGGIVEKSDAANAAAASRGKVQVDVRFVGILCRIGISKIG